MKRAGYITKMVRIGIVFLSLVLLPALVLATDVQGVIDSDTTWTLAGSPYIVVGHTLVASGARLTIEPSVQVRFNGPYYLRIDGNIQAKGSFNNEILFTSNLTPQQRNDWTGITTINNTGSELSWVIVEFADTAVTVSGGTGNKINNCTIRHSALGVLLSSENLMVNNNYIYNCDDGATIANYDSIYFMNNTLENIMGIGIFITNFSNPSINHNNFLDVTSWIIHFGYYTNGLLDARYNYWGPLTTAEMDSKGPEANIAKIRDFYDDPAQGKVDYDNWLSAPNPEAYPDPNASPSNFIPVANAGADQAVFDTVTLDGSASYDPDGEVASYEWTLTHRETQEYNRTASRVTPTVSTLNSGFYDVTCP